MKRRLALAEWGVLVLPAAAVLVVAAPDAPDPAPGGRMLEARAASAKAQTVKSPAGNAALTLEPRSVAPAEPSDLFARWSWQVAAPAAPASSAGPASPASPSAPPLPFTFLGEYRDGDTGVIFLTTGDRVISVRTGDVIEGTYRVDEVSGTSLGITYLPLNIKQFLPIGAPG